MNRWRLRAGDAETKMQFVWTGRERGHGGGVLGHALGQQRRELHLGELKGGRGRGRAGAIKASTGLRVCAGAGGRRGRRPVAVSRPCPTTVGLALNARDRAMLSHSSTRLLGFRCEHAVGLETDCVCRIDLRRWSANCVCRMSVNR